MLQSKHILRNCNNDHIFTTFDPVLSQRHFFIYNLNSLEFLRIPLYCYLFLANFSYIIIIMKISNKACINTYQNVVVEIVFNKLFNRP